MGDELVDAVQHDRDEEGRPRAPPALVKQLDTAFRVRHDRPKVPLLSLSRILDAGA